MHKLKNSIKAIIFGLIIGMLLELFVFKFFRNLPKLGVQKDVSIDAEEMIFINWVQDGSVCVSELDPTE